MAHDPKNAASEPEDSTEMTDADLADVAGAGSTNAAGSPSYFDQNS